MKIRDGSFSKGEFPGLDVIEAIDYKRSAYESWIAEPDAGQSDQGALDYLKSKIGIDYQIKLAKETKEGVWEAIDILLQHPNVSYATPVYISERDGTTEHGNDPVPPEKPHGGEPPAVGRELLFPAPPYNHDFIPGNILVGFKAPYFGSFSAEEFPGLEFAEIDDYKRSAYETWGAEPDADQHDQDAMEFLRSRIGIDYQIKLASPTKEGVWEAIKIFEKNPNVHYAMPVFIMEHTSFPNDPGFPNQWGMVKIQALQAWLDGITGSYSAEVAILDTGIDHTHPDLNANVLLSKGFNISLGMNADTMDYDGKGTHVAGIIGAVGNNNLGVAGVNWKVSMAPIKISQSNFNPTTTMPLVELGVMRAKTNKLPIINLSYEVSYHPALVVVVENYDGLMVISAGNTADNNDIYSMNYQLNNLGNVIFVANSNAIDDLTSTSNYGPATVALAAPGTAIYSTLPGPGYGNLGGTSAAAPHVAGAAALLLSIAPDLTAQELKAAILDGVDKVPILSGKVSTGGRLNVYKTVKPYKPRTIHGYVWPIATNEVVPGFLQMHDIVVELREKYYEPALPGMSTTAVIYDAINAEGEFTIENVPLGTYVLVIKRPGYLVRALEITVSKTDNDIIELVPPPPTGQYDPLPFTDNGVFKLWCGDCDGDNRVDNSDSVLIMELSNANVSVHNLSQFYNPACDLNADGYIDDVDFQMVFLVWDRYIREYAGSEDMVFIRPPSP